MTYPQLAVTVDVAIFRLLNGALHCALVRRDAEPFAGSLALPGGYVHGQEDGTLEDAARRVLRDKTGVETPYLEQVASFGDMARDPRGWSVSIAYMALIRPADEVAEITQQEGDRLHWVPADETALPEPLAFDHARILDAAIRRLRDKVEYSSLPAHLLPEHFTLPELQAIYENLIGRPLDKSAFRKRMAEADFVTPVEGVKRAASHRPPQVYRLKDEARAVLFNRVL
ncbi:NUDIX hydrolase [Rhizobium sp. G187]|uniref:NUDIX hydrolase n=1 Tax=Rhizobium sp. G187 TaxID=3451352 RepID=UPI003EE7AB0F